MSQPPAAPNRRQRNLKRLLSPRTVAFVGGQGMAPVIQDCLRNGFPKDRLFAVNPKYDEIAGIPCVKTLADLAEPPDASFLAVPREMTIDMVRELSRLGAGGAVAYAAGFAEIGGEGKELQRQLIEAAGDLAVVGPNCYGLVNYVDGLNMLASPPGGHRVERGVALVMQSGNIALNATNHHRGLPLSYVITAGNQAVLELADYVDCLADDSRVTAIALYIEGLRDVPRFARACMKAMANGKPVVALKAGRSELGAKFAASHTGSLAGSDRLYDALFRRLGIASVHSLADMLETAKLMHVCGWPTGNKLVVFTCSGGECLMTADHAVHCGVELPAFSAGIFEKLRAQLPNFATVANPLDYNTSLWGDLRALTQCFGNALSDPYDAGMLMIDFPPPEETAGYEACFAATGALIAAGKAHGKPVAVCATLPELLPADAQRRCLEAGAAPMQGLHAGLDAFGVAAAAGVRRSEILAAGSAATEIYALPPVAEDRHILSEDEGKRALAAYSLTVPKGRIATAAEAPAAAKALGFPVVVKLAEPALAHKTEAGAVQLNLKSEAEVSAAVAAIAANLARYKPGAKAQKFLVEKMVGGVVAELIVGVKRDPQFGLVLVVGAGGILVELVEDAATLLLPTSRDEVAAALRGLKVAKLLKGYRGKPAGDLEAAIEAVMAVVAYADAARDKLVELDVNPLMVLPKGQGVVAVDALVVTAA